MDEAIQEKIAEYLYKNFTIDGAKSMPYWSGVRDSLRQRLLKDAGQILSLMLPKDKPPLQKGNPYSGYDDHRFGSEAVAYDNGKEAQREADIKHYEGG